jgi:hypothetical protein
MVSKTRASAGKVSSRVAKTVFRLPRKCDHGRSAVGNHFPRGLVMEPLDVNLGSVSTEILENTAVWQARMYSLRVVGLVCRSDSSARCRSSSARCRSSCCARSASSARRRSSCRSRSASSARCRSSSARRSASCRRRSSSANLSSSIIGLERAVSCALNGSARSSTSRGSLL